MNEWQTMETAPKDGTQILVCFSKDMGYERIVVSYEPEVEGTNYPWIACEGNAYHADCPIAWMPLPTPPSTVVPGVGK